MPVAATPASTAANSRSSQAGALPRSIESIAACPFQSLAVTATMITTHRTRKTMPRRSTRPSRAAVSPRTFPTAIQAIAATAAITSHGWLSRSPQNAAR
jgi:hypothetical protein